MSTHVRDVAAPHLIQCWRIERALQHLRYVRAPRCCLLVVMRCRLLTDQHCQRSLGAGAHVHGLGSGPDSIDADRWAKPRIKRAQLSGSAAGHFTVIDLSPSCSEMITVSSVPRLAVAFTGTKAGKGCSSLIPVNRTDHVGVDAVVDGFAGNGRIWFSTCLLSMGTTPSFK